MITDARSPRPTLAALAVLAALALWTAVPAAPTASAQEAPDTLDPGWTSLGASPFRPLPLPAPNTIRNGAGRPGPDHWTQRADYSIRATLDTATHRIEGWERIRYLNRSPDRLPYLWLKLDGSLCGEESIGGTLEVPPLQFGEITFDFQCRGGSAVEIEGIESRGRALEHAVHGTAMRVDLPEPLEPGHAVDLVVEWSWEVPEYGFARTEREGTLHQVAAWYPRMAVYDDLRGWNTRPFVGAGEFYQEFGDFEVELTLPAGYVVAATGRLLNPGEVLTGEQRDRLERARGSAEAVAIIDADEARDARDDHPEGTKTWRFRAEDVRDFAFAGAPDFRWDASSWDGTMIHTFYRPEAAEDGWEEANRMARHTIRYFSERILRYPWPHATVVEGPIGGMEYPMIVYVPRSPTREEFFWVLTHELGHEWFPMQLSSNERRYFWQDEGLNTFVDHGSIQEYFAGEPYADTVVSHLLKAHEVHAIPGWEQPSMLPPDELKDLFWAAYQKPALMLHLLRQEVMGVERFDRAFREYAEAWRYRHPSPADFFRIMEDASGMELDWFWRGWLYTTARLDHAIAGVEETDGGGSAVRIRSEGGMIMPVELRLDYVDGSSETVRLPVQMWYQGPVFTYRTSRRVTAAELDPRGVYPDVDGSNDRWEPGGGE